MYNGTVNIDFKNKNIDTLFSFVELFINNYLLFKKPKSDLTFNLVNSMANRVKCTFFHLIISVCGRYILQHFIVIEIINNFFKCLKKD